jgi:hypothetical protein
MRGAILREVYTPGGHDWQPVLGIQKGGVYVQFGRTGTWSCGRDRIRAVIQHQPGGSAARNGDRRLPAYVWDKKERREREFLTESAEARYQMLLEDSPGLFDKVKQKDIARYLGITPVALSRIRGRSGRVV